MPGILRVPARRVHRACGSQMKSNQWAPVKDQSESFPQLEWRPSEKNLFHQSIVKVYFHNLEYYLV